ncbi:hypothetical protein ACP275_11G049000 [Erythranthe tilingii]
MASSSSSSSSLESIWNQLPARMQAFRKIGNVHHDSVVLRHHGRRYTVEILISTGQVISWKNQNDDELLFVSEKSIIRKDEPILGGIPVCFPRFIKNGNVENTFPAGWLIDDSVPQPDDKPMLALILGPSHRDSLNWPNEFEFRIKYQLVENGTLEMESRIENTDDHPFTFQFCYQNYLAASYIGNIRIRGLVQLEYLDYLENKKRFTERDYKIPIRSEVDRVYVDVPAGGNNNKVINVVDHGKGRTYTIERSGTSLPDIVVWNPWIEKAKRIGDMGDEEYRKMACVGPAAVVDPVTLNPGEAWTGKQSISIEEETSSVC